MSGAKRGRMTPLQVGHGPMQNPRHSRRALLGILAAPLIAAHVETAAHRSRGRGASRRTATASAPTARQILRGPPFIPTNTALFMPVAYADAPPLAVPESGPEREEELYFLLETQLRARLGDGAAVTQALTGFAAPATRAKIPSPLLRAALYGLTGTIAEPAIGGILETYARVRFTRFPAAFATIIARSRLTPHASAREVEVNQRFRHEDWRFLAASVMTHEALHHEGSVEKDDDGDNKEELIAKCCETLCYAQLLLEQPAISRRGSYLGRRLNTRILALLNSRFADGRIRILGATAPSIFPGGAAYPSFAAYVSPVSARNANTPGNPTLRAMLGNVIDPDALIADTPHFDDTTLRLLDEGMSVFAPRQWLEMARILALDVEPSVVSPTTATRAGF